MIRSSQFESYQYTVQVKIRIFVTMSIALQFHMLNVICINNLTTKG